MIFEVKEDEPQSKLLLIGDFNADGKVNSIDLTLLIDKLGSTDPLFDEDGSGLVDMKDLQMYIANADKETMLRGDLVHGAGHCKISNAEVALVESHIGMPAIDTLTRLADLDNDGFVTEKDADLMRRQRDLADNKGIGAKPSVDINCDGSVGQEDFKLIIKLWGNQEFNFSWADVNEDGKVGIKDLLDVLAAWN